MPARSLAPAVTILAAFSLGLTSESLATTITTADGQGADAFVQAGTNANTNYGTLEQLLIKNDCCTVNLHRKTYLRFDLAAVGALIVDAATLTLTDYVSSGTFSYRLYGLSDGNAGELWNEATITWNTAPENTVGSPTDMEAGATLLETFSSGDPIVVSSSALVSFLNADTDGVATLILTRVTSSSQVPSFASKEHATVAPPTLQLTLIPEPSTVLLLALGLAGLARSRRSG